MKHRRSSKRKNLKYIAVALSVVLLLTGAFLLLHWWESRQDSSLLDGSYESVVRYNGSEYVEKKNIETFLVMGLDKFEDSVSNDSYNNDQQADFLLLLVFNHDEQKCNVLNINRDTMVDMNILGVAGQRVGTVNKQIALSHTYGNGKDVSCRNTANALSGLLNGVKIDHYISLTMDAVSILNDLLGGVEVTVLDDFSDIDPTLVKGETVTLYGEHALTYVRTRYGLEDSSNSTRINRQRQYLNSLYQKASARVEADSEFIVEAYLKLADYIVTDRSENQLKDIADKLSSYELVETDSFEGEYKVGEKFMEFYPDEKSVNRIVFDLFYDRRVN